MNDEGNTTVVIPSEQYQALQKVSERLHMPVTELLEQIIAELLKRYQAENPPCC